MGSLRDIQKKNYKETKDEIFFYFSSSTLLIHL